MFISSSHAQHGQREFTALEFCAIRTATGGIEQLEYILSQRDDIQERLASLTAQALAGGGETRIERQHAKGKMTARERIDAFLDPNSFEEFDQLKTHRCADFNMQDTKFPGDGVVTDTDSRWSTVFVFAQDFTVFGGSPAVPMRKRFANHGSGDAGAPVIGLNDSGGARIQEGVESLAGYADIFLRNTLASGRILS